MYPWAYLAAAVPPEIAGLPTWALNGLSIGGLVIFILTGLATARLWTKGQVDRVFKEHDREVANLKASHDREVENLKNQSSREVKNLTDRYETHLKRTVELYQGRVDDARSHETEWREVAARWQSVAEMLGAGIEPMQEQSATTLQILQAWQAGSRKGNES